MRGEASKSSYRPRSHPWRRLGLECVPEVEAPPVTCRELWDSGHSRGTGSAGGEEGREWCDNRVWEGRAQAREKRAACRAVSKVSGG